MLSIEVELWYFVETKLNMKKNQLCDKVVEFLLTQKVDDLAALTVAEIARRFNVSQSFLNRKFKLERNFPLREYLFREKMARSALLLREDDRLTIKDISKKMGFLDIDYFTYVFKNHFGIPPGRYRDCKNNIFEKKQDK